MASIMQNHNHHRAESIDGPFQTEMESTSDETHMSLKRKSISLNSGSDLQVTMAGTLYVVSELSKEQKRDMRKRLRTELQQVRNIMDRIGVLEEHVRTADKEVSSHPSAVTAAPPASLPPPLEIPPVRGSIGRQGSFAGSEGGTPGTTAASSKEKRTPKANQMYCNSEYINAKDKMPPPEKLKPKQFGLGPGSVISKKSGAISGSGVRSEYDVKRQKVESSRQRRMGDMMKQCSTILKKLMTHKHAWVFNEPVDVVKLCLHDYNKVIKRPMDLGTIKKKLEAGHYGSPVDFSEDVKLTFSNAMTYNPPGHDVFVMADILRKQFEERWKGVREKLSEEQIKCRAEDEVLAKYNSTNNTQQIRDLKQHLSNIEDQLSSLSKAPASGAGASKTTSLKNKSSSSVKNRPMSFEEKKRLSDNLMVLPAEQSTEIVTIIRKHHPNLCRDKDEIELDIDLVDNETLWELEKFVARCFNPKSSKKKSTKPSEHAATETVKTSAGAESPKKRKSIEGTEEDVDIDVDDDNPLTNFPPVVIDKDAGNEGSKTTGDTSDSSSGSSDSESDSGSSSGSDSEEEGTRPSGTEKPASQKEPMGLGVRSGQSDSHQHDGVVKKPLSPGEHPDVVEGRADTSNGAENSAAEKQVERQVSPEKNLRAALLKGRFADTILKAREKTFPLNKGDNADPEKLRKEREELEKKQREDRARLQAEANAAKLARRKAEAEAALEVRKKIEAEREAARRQLSQMERTVELDAQCEVLKDFDLLRTTSMEHFQSSAGEVSPANSPNEVFLQGGGNPLEQLGLYMKLDEEEDEKQGDGEVAYAEGTDENGEVEEGEID